MPCPIFLARADAFPISLSCSARTTTSLGTSALPLGLKVYVLRVVAVLSSLDPGRMESEERRSAMDATRAAMSRVRIWQECAALSEMDGWMDGVE